MSIDNNNNNIIIIINSNYERINNNFHKQQTLFRDRSESTAGRTTWSSSLWGGTFLTEWYSCYIISHNIILILFNEVVYIFNIFADWEAMAYVTNGSLIAVAASRYVLIR